MPWGKCLTRGLGKRRDDLRQKKKRSLGWNLLLWSSCRAILASSNGAMMNVSGSTQRPPAIDFVKALPCGWSLGVARQRGEQQRGWIQVWGWKICAPGRCA